jgi:hypothetical protein
MPGEHEFYEKDGLEYARVSTILDTTEPIFHPQKTKILENWRKSEPDHAYISSRSQERGTLIHSAIERFLLNDQYVSDTMPSVEELLFHNIPVYMNYLEPFLKEVKEKNGARPEWPGLANGSMLVEQPIYSVHGYAGTPDFRFWLDGKYTVWDTKTARSVLEKGVKKKRRPKSRYSEAIIQTAAYALAHNLENKETGYYPLIEQCAIGVCYDWTEPTVFEIPLDEVRAAAEEFIERFQVYQEIENSTFPRRIVEK